MRPVVRVNQLGYLPDGPKRATLVTRSAGPVPFTVRTTDGATLGSGRSEPWPVRPEPTSGLDVHVLDLTGLTGSGVDLRVVTPEGTSHPFAVRPDLYRDLRADALRFFRLMRSGDPVPEEAAPGYGRPAGHLGRLPNRGDTAVRAWTGPDAERLYPGWHEPGTFDVSGGWYDAGDYGKYVTSGAIAVWQLLSTLDLLVRAGAAAQTSRFAASLVEECRWQLDWLLRMQVGPGHRWAGMAFHRVHGADWSPMPGRADQDPTERVLHRPSTPATLQLAAAAAHAARLLGGTDPGYARRLLAAATTAFAAAQRHPRLVPPDDHARFGGGPYDDDRFDDDFYWAAAELWLATGEDRYRRLVLGSPEHRTDPFDPAGFDCDRVSAPARIDLALAGPTLDGHAAVVESVRRGADRLLDLQARQPWGQPYAPPAGWDWGSNGRLLNNLVVLGVAHLLSGDRAHRDAVAGGVDYLLGRNALGQSYVTGYGSDFSRHQRTRQFGHDLDPALPPPPAGALAGGANSRPAPDFPYDPRLVGRAPQCCYLDEPTSEVTNDVCIRWNAPLVWVTTFLDLAAAAPTPATLRSRSSG